MPIESGVIYNWKTQQSTVIKDEEMNEYICMSQSYMVDTGVVVAMVMGFDNLKLVKFEKESMALSVIQDFGSAV